MCHKSQEEHLHKKRGGLFHATKIGLLTIFSTMIYDYDSYRTWFGHGDYDCKVYIFQKHKLAIIKILNFSFVLCCVKNLCTYFPVHLVFKLLKGQIDAWFFLKTLLTYNKMLCPESQCMYLELINSLVLKSFFSVFNNFLTVIYKYISYVREKWK